MIQTTIAVDKLSRFQLDEVQTLLKQLGYYRDIVDGVFGKNTAHAFAEWKADNYLSDTDLIGAASYGLLKEQAGQGKTEDKISWSNFDSKVSKYFTVGEVALNQKDRIPVNPEHRRNIVRLAKLLDQVREWWGSPIRVTSWYRPPHVERRVGGSFHTHPFGLAADIAPANGRIAEFQNRFEKEWYQTGKWKGGFGRGAKKGFVHLDTKNKRVWNY